MQFRRLFVSRARARRDLWAALETAPGEVLSRAQLPGPRCHCIKDLLFHIAEVEDGWVNGDIRGAAMVQHDIQVLEESASGLEQVVAVEDWPDKRLTVDGLLWHVMIHEMRHTAQIAALLRLRGVAPPSLDLLFYLPKA